MKKISIPTLMVGCRSIPDAHAIVAELKGGTQIEYRLEADYPNAVACYSNNTRIGYIDTIASEQLSEALAKGLHAKVTISAPAIVEDERIVATPRLSVEISDTPPLAELPGIVGLLAPNRNDRCGLAALALEKAQAAIASKDPCVCALWLRDAGIHVHALLEPRHG